MQVKLIKMGGRLVRHSRRLIFQLSEVSVPRWLFHVYTFFFLDPCDKVPADSPQGGSMKKWVGAILLVLFLSAVQRAGGTGEALGWLLIIGAYNQSYTKSASA